MPRTAFEYQGALVVVAKAGRIWHVQVADRKPVSSRYLDLAVAVALPKLRRRELDRLLVRLLDWNLNQRRDEDAAEPAANGSAG